MIVAIQVLNGPHGATSRINWTLYGLVLQVRQEYIAATTEAA